MALKHASLQVTMGTHSGASAAAKSEKMMHEEWTETQCSGHLFVD
jgi:hypothetical protein